MIPAVAPGSQVLLPAVCFGPVALADLRPELAVRTVSVCRGRTAPWTDAWPTSEHVS